MAATSGRVAVPGGPGGICAANPAARDSLPCASSKVAAPEQKALRLVPLALVSGVEGIRDVFLRANGRRYKHPKRACRNLKQGLIRVGSGMAIGLGHLEATRLGTTLIAAFLASLVECVEALTVVLAVGSVRGWRSALVGAAAALAVLAAIIAAVGPALTRIPLHMVQLVVGVMILLFGLRWLRKAILDRKSTRLN